MDLNISSKIENLGVIKQAGAGNPEGLRRPIYYGKTIF